MRASDFRRTARQALSGKWPVAVLAALVMLLLGLYSTDGLRVNYDLNGSSLQLFFRNHLLGALSINGKVSLFLGGALSAMFLLGALLWLVLFVLRSVVNVGYAQFNLDLVDGEEPRIQTLSSFFSHFEVAFLTHLLTTLYTILWSLLLIIPGIMAGYSYAMTSYILAENPDLSAGEAIRRSKEMMRGNRWRLFCLQFSFIGWSILCSLTPMGIGRLLLNPYSEAATAAFYRDLTAPHAAGSSVSGDPWDF